MEHSGHDCKPEEKMTVLSQGASRLVIPEGEAGDNSSGCGSSSRVYIFAEED